MLMPALSVQIEPFQESPQLLDPHLQSYLTPLTSVFLARLPPRPPPLSAPSPSSPLSSLSPRPPSPSTLHPPIAIHDAIAKLLYTLCKIRGPKIISRFLPNEPRWLESLCVFAASETPGRSWELRYILLLWLSHLLLTPFDLSTISDASHSIVVLPAQLAQLPGLPGLSRRLLALAITHLSSPGNRESDAASLLLVRLCLRKDMRALGLLSAVVVWCLHLFTPGAAQGTTTSTSTLFLKTAVLRALAGILAQGDRDVVAPFAPDIFALAVALEAGDGDGDEWNSANVRRLGMKIYRWVGILSLAPEGGDSSENSESSNTAEDIIERLLSSLGDKDTAVRFGASKSLAVISRKLPPDLAGDVLDAVMGIYDEDVFHHGNRKMLSAVTAEKWHGATLTLATFLRQRAVRSTHVLERVVHCIVDSLRFEQRRATFALGGNVRDAACYAAWSLARSYSTAELLAVGDIDGHGNVQQLLATELAVAGCLDPLGNIRRAASAAMQELIGRHPNTIIEGIRVVQVVDYNAVALRRRSVITVAGEVARLAEVYWTAITEGVVDGWRGVGSSDLDGRKLSGQGLGEVVVLSLPGDNEEARNRRAQKVVSSLIHRIRTEGKSDVEIWHGGTWALSEVLDRLSTLTSASPLLTPAETTPLLESVFEKLGGKEFLNPILRPELTSESASRLVSALSSSSTLLVQQGQIPIKTLRLWTAIVEASLDRNDDSVLEQAVPAAKSFFRILSEKNRQRIIDSWRRRTTSGRKRGYVLALGEVLDFVYIDEALRPTVIKTLIAAAERLGEIELRVAGIRALGSGVIVKEGLQDPAVAAVVLKALDDYEVDSRGDVGSWARAEGIKVVFENWGGEGLRGDVNGDVEWEVVNRIVRLSVERLDRVRTRACEALLKISASWEEKELEVFIDRYIYPPLSSPLTTTPVANRQQLKTGTRPRSLLRVIAGVLRRPCPASPAPAPQSRVSKRVRNVRRRGLRLTPQDIPHRTARAPRLNLLLILILLAIIRLGHTADNAGSARQEHERPYRHTRARSHRRYLGDAAVGCKHGRRRECWDYRAVKKSVRRGPEDPVQVWQPCETHSGRPRICWYCPGRGVGGGTEGEGAGEAGRDAATSISEAKGVGRRDCVCPRALSGRRGCVGRGKWGGRRDS